MSVLAAHPEISLRKEKIFIKSDPEDRKTKIVCTLGYKKTFFYLFYFI
jgi:hypothetical protein